METELEKNLAAFKEVEASLSEEHAGKTVLLHDGAVIEIYNDSGDAYKIGVEKFGLGNFSLETVGVPVKSLGFASSVLLEMGSA